MILKYKVTIPNSVKFYRDCEFKGTTSLFKVMEFVQSQMNFVPDMMVLFQGLDSNGKVLHEYGLFDMGDGSIDNVSIEETGKRGDVRLRFVYNLSMNLYLDFTFEGCSDIDGRAEYPRVTDEKGHAPQQFSAVYVEDDYENRPHGVPHPVEENDADGDEDDDAEEEGFDESELPEGTE